ncbi:PEGA domain-containing protein, partial [Gemmatimonadota bacterium]
AVLFSAISAADRSPGEIIAAAETQIPATVLDPASSMEPASGVRSFGLPGVPAPGEDRPGASGQLTVLAETADGIPAWVYIDGRGFGVAPVVANVEPGSRLVTVTASGHQPFSEAVEVARGESSTSRVRLRRGEGSLVVTSAVEEADIYLDGVRVGQTPTYRTRVPSGDHTVSVVRDGFEPYVRTITVEHDETISVAANLLEHPGTLLVLCLQDSIHVAVDGASAGVCSTDRPLRMEDVAAGTHRVRGDRGNRRTPTRDARVVGDRTTSIELSLSEPIEPAVPVTPDTGASGHEEDGPSQEAGIFLGVALLGGESRFDLTLADTSGSFDVRGTGVHGDVLAQGRNLRLSLGVDLLFLEDFGSFDGSNTYWDVYLGGSAYANIAEVVRPFVSLRGLYGVFTFEQESPPTTFPTTGGGAFSSGGFGWAAEAGLDIQFSPKVSFELAASYSKVGLSEVTDGSRTVGRVDGFELVRGYIGVRIRTRWGEKQGE